MLDRVFAALDHKQSKGIELGVGVVGIVNVSWRLDGVSESKDFSNRDCLPSRLS